ncbi:MAG: BRO-N domain-containing protein [Pseudomonas asiatica]
MGIELDVLVGHPEHDLLFVATQVGKAAGLKAPSASLSLYLSTNKITEGVMRAYDVFKVVKDVPNKRVIQATTWLATESVVYKMLLASTAPQTEPFRKWVTEEVLPSIRKTGQYNAAESSDPIALGIMDELKALRGELVELKGRTKSPPLTSQGLPKG